MEQFAKMELQGYVGSITRFNNSDKPSLRFTIGVTTAYMSRDGAPAMDTLWVNVYARECADTPDISMIQKGARLNVMGRFKMSKYFASDGTERQSPDVYATRLTLLNPNEPLVYGMP